MSSGRPERALDGVPHTTDSERMFRTNVQNGCDVAIVGAGLAGMATALRLQMAGRSTVVLESHGHAGGCAGYYRRRGFAFDVGATTLVDFEPGGVGARLFDEVGLPPVAGEPLSGYCAWLPDRTHVVDQIRRSPHRHPDPVPAGRPEHLGQPVQLRPEPPVRPGVAEHR